MPENHYLIPVQSDGLEKDRYQSLSAESIEAAEDFFVDAKERLLDVNNWGQYGYMPNVAFKLTDVHGNPLKRRARKGDHIRISLNGYVPGTPADAEWAWIDAIVYDDYPDENSEAFAMRVRPCLNPTHTKELGLPASSLLGATSTFVISREGKKLFSAYHGRNEFEDEDTMAQGGFHATSTLSPCAWLGLTDVQCISLIKGFIQ